MQNTYLWLQFSKLDGLFFKSDRNLAYEQLGRFSVVFGHIRSS